MQMPYPKRWHFSLIILCFLIFACKPAGEAPSAEADVTQTQATSIASNGEIDEPEEVQIEIETGPGSFFFVDRSAGLSGLSSYTATLTVSFEGTEGGQTNNWTGTYDLVHTQDPSARALTFTTPDDLLADYPSLQAEMDGMAYEVSREGVCAASVIEAEEDLFRNQFMEPAAKLHSVYGAEEGGPESISGIPAQHYTFDQRALIDSGILEAGGELWVASEGGFLVKYLLSITANEEYFGEGIEGVMTWDYELTSINETPAPTLPDSCRINAPMLADASNVINQPDWLRFDTALSIADAAAFYQEQLPDLGWVAQTDPLLPEPLISETDAVLRFVQGSQTLTVFIFSTDGQTTTVNLVRAEIEE